MPVQLTVSIDSRYPAGSAIAPTDLRPISPCSPRSPTNCNTSLSASHGRRDLAHEDRCPWFSAPASSVTTKWDEPPTSTASAGPVSAAGNNNGTVRCRNAGAAERQQSVAQRSTANRIGILAGDFTRPSSGTGAGRTRWVTRSSCLDPGHGRRAPGSRSAIDCSTLTATTYTSPSSRLGGG